MYGASLLDAAALGMDALVLYEGRSFWLLCWGRDERDSRTAVNRFGRDDRAAAFEAEVICEWFGASLNEDDATFEWADAGKSRLDASDLVIEATSGFLEWEGSCGCLEEAEDREEVDGAARNFVPPGGLSSECRLDGITVGVFNSTSKSGPSSSAGGALVRA